MTTITTGLGRLGDETFAGVIFDMDGTLIDSTPAVQRAWTQWAVEYQLTAEDLAGYYGVPAAGIVNALLPPNQRAAGLQRINELELADTSGIGVLPGARRAFDALRYAPNAIATSCTAPLAAARLRASELTAPSVLITVDDVQHGKPAPDPFLTAAERMGVDPQRCLVVEDAPNGLLAARAAGCFTLAVVTTTPAAELVADAVVRDLSRVCWQVTDDGIRLTLAPGN